jgi:DNA (cytosine-5)-methyltransferase 1
LTLTFVDLFAGLGGFHLALKRLRHKCVFASEIDSELREIYKKNFPNVASKTYGDIRKHKDQVPPHDVLCAGFPCQPFSKSGAQKGLRDKTDGTLFHEVIAILRHHRPRYVILENVGNFERHDGGRTWKIVRKSLERLDYEVTGTEHLKSGGTGLLSPHHFGFPHRRERFFIVAQHGGLPPNPLPRPSHNLKTDLRSILQKASELSPTDRVESRISEEQRACISHWNEQLEKMPEGEVTLPSFPIWADEMDATYPYEHYTPYVAPISELKQCIYGQDIRPRMTREEILLLFPSYARSQDEQFPDWKIQFIRQNREWFKEHRRRFSNAWVSRLRLFPSSLRKLEWNCQGEERNLWRHVLQFRPSGLRVKRYTSSPSLVAMTTTQIPILGPQERFMTRVEGLRLQGFPDSHQLPKARAAAFKALGNGVHVDVVEAIARQLLQQGPYQE